ncbi:MAG: hemerythrin [Betaproteobacteria bacterium]|nr:hemerythrin [Betaproteobacteria bacterium]MCC6250125.1 hemerythrin [Rubrivivax sp.]MCL4696216.1 hemerythrin [Burkholderiaceae bacterium]
MTTLAWRSEFELKQARMDRTHVEFVELLEAVETATPGAAANAALGALLEHTVAHFEQEEQWMGQLGFAAENCHAMQHQSVLQVLREVVRRHGLQADEALVRALVTALAEWFPVHATMMDAALAMTMAERGFDAETGTLAEPLPAGAAAITGCGGGSCG